MLPLLLAAPAGAAYAPGAFPASSLGSELGDASSRSPLLSADGRHVVYSTSSSVLLGAAPNPAERRAQGLVRKDTATGRIELVAPPRTIRRDDGSTVDAGTTGGATGVSADGRYVAFTTEAQLTPGDGVPETTDVYVRDMTRPVGDPDAYELASARDGEELGAAYEDPDAGSTGGLSGFGLSADGRRVVFTTLGASDLPARATTATPRWQVWVRDLDADTTRLISRDVTDASAAGTPAQPPAPGDGVVPPVAALSADGTTVVWTAGEAQRQTPTLPGEGSLGARPSLLWRRLDRGPVPARRVAGAADLDDPTCAPPFAYSPSTTATGPCYGPFVQAEGADQIDVGSSLDLQGVSGDGRRVLFGSAAGFRPYDFAAYRSNTRYLADMQDGLPRKSAVRVAWSSPNDIAGRFPILGGRLAADGRHAVLTSRDVRVDGLQGVGTFPTGDLITHNVFAVDLDARTVELVTRAADGTDYSTGRADLPVGLPPALSADASAIAFSAADGNLFVGDANGVDDVLVARAAPPSSGRGTRDLPAPAGPVLPDPAMPTQTVPTPLQPRYLAIPGRVEVDPRTGVATVRVSLPAAGSLRTTARGIGKHTVRRAGRRRTVTTKVTVGTTRRTVSRATTVTVRIRVGARARRALLRGPRTLTVRVDLRFVPRAATPSTSTRSYRLSRSAVAPRSRARTRSTAPGSHR